MKRFTIITMIMIVYFILISCSKETTSPEKKLLAPTNLQISLVENNKIKLIWQDNSNNETKFLIDRKKGEFDWFENYGEVEPNITAFPDEIPTNSDTIYSYRVRAFDGIDYSAYSDTVAWFSEITKPSNLQLVQIAQDSIKLTWQDNSIGEQNFRIDRRIGNENWQKNYKIIEPDTTSYIDYNPSLYDTCYYKVFATCGNSYSDSSQNYFIPFLPAPTNFEIEVLSATSLKLIWQDNCENEDGYLVYKMEQCNYWDSTTVPANYEEWTDENVIPGILNYYKVCAYIGNDHSGCVEDSLNTLIAPSNLTTSIINQNQILINWNDNSNFEEGYKIERKTSGESYELLTTVNQNITNFTDENVEPHITYYYRVFGFVQNFQSYYSNEDNTFFYQNEIWVPEDYSTIQEAINNANNSDSILVHPGIYVENINFNGNDIIVKSSDGPMYTTIDGNANGSVLQFTNGENSSAVLSGFTITNGNADAGGGIFCNNSNPTLNNLIIISNYSGLGGGGIHCNNSNPTINNVTIQNNNTSNHNGTNGGGIFCYNNSSPSLNNVTIIANSADDGGGIGCDNSNPTLFNVIIQDNNASGDNSRGGGINCRDSNPVINNVLILDNSSLSEGSGIYCFHSNPCITNTIIAYNLGTNYGGGISCWSSNPIFTNVTFLGNSANISYSDIQGGEAGIVTNNNGTVNWLEGNIDEDPLFIDPGNNNFHLQLGLA